MTPTRIDVNIVCAKCGKPVEKRMMEHRPDLGTYEYSVSCHGNTEKHSLVSEGAHGTTISAFTKDVQNVAKPGTSPTIVRPV